MILLSYYKNVVYNYMSANLEGTNNTYKNGMMDNIHFKATFAATVDIGLLNEWVPTAVSDGYNIMC
jgi:hypothetical protein